MRKLSARGLAVALLALPTLVTGAAQASAATGAGTDAATTVVATATGPGYSITVKGANGVTPQVMVTSCTAAMAEWFHLYSAGRNPLCIGYTGTAYITYSNSSTWCWGNNYGYVDATYLGSGRYDVHSVRIDGWSGHGTC